MSRIAAAQEAKKAKAKDRAAQAIQIELGLRVARVDEYNWQIQRLAKGKWAPWPRENYYGTLPNALKALPATLLGAEASGTLANVERRVRAISEAIDSAIRWR
jgi:hypothetical protein